MPDTTPEAADPAPAPQPEPTPEPVSVAPPASAPEPEVVPAAGPEAAPAPQPEPAPTAEAQSAPAPAPEVQRSPVAQPAPGSGPRPAVSLTPETFKKFAPSAKAEFVSVIGTSGNEVLSRFGINANSRRFCHFMAQVAHESAGFKAVEENLNYSAANMTRVFGIPAAEAQRLVGHKEAFAERVYGLGNPKKARMLGNTQPGDGYRYRGRGFIQLTGRSNYRDIGNRIEFDLENNPDLAAEPLNALKCAAAFWDRSKLNDLADQNNIEVITKRINGGHNGLDDRKNKFTTAQRIWGTDAAPGGMGRSLGPSMMGGRPVLQYGDLRPEVLEAKRLLANAGYAGFVMDEDFGRPMHMAVVQFKMDRGLPGDGIVDQDAWNALELETKPSTGRGIAPPGEALDAQDEQARRRGRAVEGWGRLLFAAAAAVVVVWLIVNKGIVPPRSSWEWAVAGFIVLVAVGSIALMGIGGTLVRAGRTRPVASTLDDVMVRPGADAHQIDTGLAWTRSLAPVEFNLVQGKRYRGKITLTGFETWASNSMVADKFRELGFTKVDVTGSGGTRMGEGTWDKPDQSVAMPSQISDVVEVA
jgi:putative chitinase